MIRWITSIALVLVTIVRSIDAQEICTNSSEDEILIEYFNELNFNNEIEVIVTDTGTEFEVIVSCPSPPSPTIPGDEFNLQLISSDKSLSTSCNTNNTPIIIDKAELAGKKYFSCANGINCEFVIIFSNRTTQTIYCETIFQLTMTNGNKTLLPNLEAATLPICNNTINKCLVDDNCSLSSEKTGTLKLCESSSSCVNEPNTKGYSLNASVYFETSLTDVIK